MLFETQHEITPCCFTVICVETISMKEMVQTNANITSREITAFSVSSGTSQAPESPGYDTHNLPTYDSIKSSHNWINIDQSTTFDGEGFILRFFYSSVTNSKVTQCTVSFDDISHVPCMFVCSTSQYWDETPPPRRFVQSKYYETQLYFTSFVSFNDKAS